MDTTSATFPLEAEMLESLILRGWGYLFRFQSCLLQEKHEVERFLQEYHAQLGGWLGDASLPKEETLPSPPALIRHLHQQQKQLYRQLVKLCHPDVVVPEYRSQAAVWLREAVDAYERGDGWKLVQLRMSIERETHPKPTYLLQLRGQYADLQTQVTITRQAIEKLRESPAYRLQQKILQARRKGYDLLGTIVAQLRPCPTYAMG